MEYHSSPPDFEFVMRQKYMFQECILCALLEKQLGMTEFVAQKISETETHYWPQVTDDAEDVDHILWKVKEHPLSYPTRVAEFAQRYWLHTSIPPEDVMLVENIELSGTQISASWELKQKMIASWYGEQEEKNAPTFPHIGDT